MSTAHSIINYQEKMIRKGYTTQDIRMWQTLCRQCLTEVGDSVKFMYGIIDLSKSNDCTVLDIIKTGRMCSEQKNINEKFMQSLLCAVVDDGSEDNLPTGRFPTGRQTSSTQMLDLTADDEDSDDVVHSEPPSASASPTRRRKFQRLIDDEADVE